MTSRAIRTGDGPSTLPEPLELEEPCAAFWTEKGDAAADRDWIPAPEVEVVSTTAAKSVLDAAAVVV